MGSISFGHALDLMQQGYAVTRKGWNGKGLFVFMQVITHVDNTVVPNMTSLPTRVKDIFNFRVENGGPVGLNYSNQFCIVDRDNNINGWVPSSSDLTSEDWRIATDELNGVLFDQPRNI